MSPANENVGPVLASVLDAVPYLENVETRQVLALCVRLLTERTGPIMTKRAFDMALVMSPPSVVERCWLSLDEITARVGEHYGFTVDQLRAPNGEKPGRGDRITRARHEAYWMAKQQCWACGKGRYTTPMIGRYFGGRDHTTILHGVQRHDARLGKFAA